MIFEGETAKSILKTLDTAKIAPYSEEEKIKAERKIQELLNKRISDKGLKRKHVKKAIKILNKRK